MRSKMFVSSRAINHAPHRSSRENRFHQEGREEGAYPLPPVRQKAAPLLRAKEQFCSDERAGSLPVVSSRTRQPRCLFWRLPLEAWFPFPAKDRSETS